MILLDRASQSRHATIPRNTAKYKMVFLDQLVHVMSAPYEDNPYYEVRMMDPK